MSIVGSYVLENLVLMPESEAKAPRPRDRTLGGEGGGGGPMREAKGSESEAELGVGERARFDLPFACCRSRSLLFLPVDRLFKFEAPSWADEDDAEGDLRREDWLCFVPLLMIADLEGDRDRRRW